MSNTETPTPPSAGAEINHLTNPADLLPAQIAEALVELAKRDGVSITVRCHHGKTPEVSYQVVECRRISPDEIYHESRTGVAPTYAAALAACRAAEFSDGKERAK